ncbi:Lipopolysaccharide heptosyltransferase 1 [Gammaproteobacteria bacterium]
MTVQKLAPKKILIVKTSSLGDLVHTLPAVTDLARQSPDIRVDWVAEEAFTDIPALHPAVGRIIPIALRRWRKTPWHPTVRRELANFRKTLRAVEYDLVLDHQGLLKSAVIACLARGWRCGLDWHSAREPLAALCYDQCCPVARDQHAVTRNRALAACVLGYGLPADPPDYGIDPLPISSVVGLTLPERYMVCLHATSRAGKNWYADHWVTLGRTLANRGWSCLLPWGNQTERLAATTIADEIPHALVLPTLTLRELAGVLSGAEIVIGMDTGLTHLAAALGRPTIALYTDTVPRLTGVVADRKGWAINLGERGRIPTPEQVAAALRI